MVSINLLEVKNKEQIAKVIRKKMDDNGIMKSEIITGTNLSLTAINNVLCLSETNKDYKFETLLKILKFLKIQVFIGHNKNAANEVLTLFK